MEKPNSMESFENITAPENEVAQNQSRRDFIKKGLAFLAVTAVAPTEVIGQTAEKEKPLVDMVIEGQRMVMRPADIKLMEKIFKVLEAKSAESISRSFDPEIQRAIVTNMGDKLMAGLLKAQELGFKFDLRDSGHAHLLVEGAVSESIKRKYPNVFSEDESMRKLFPDLPKKETPSKEDMNLLTKNIKALIFHCAEFPTSEQILDEEFMRRTYPNRSVVVDEHNQAFNAKPKHPKQRPDGSLPDFGMLVVDYNELRGTDFHDLAVPENNNNTSIFEFISDIQFIPASEKDGGVKLDPKLPFLKFAISGYENDITGSKK